MDPKNVPAKFATIAADLENFRWQSVVLAALLCILGGLQIRAQSAPANAAPLPSFEVASIKPDPSGGPQVRFMLPSGRFTATNVTAKMLIEYAYNVKSGGMALRDDPVSGGPSWLNSDHFDVDAKVEDSLVKEQEQKLPFEEWAGQVRLMLQSLLAERFKLKVTHTTKELPVYLLVIAKGGSKLAPSTVPPIGPSGSLPTGADPVTGSSPPKGPMMKMGRSQLMAVGLPVGGLAAMLSREPELAGREVIDKTGLTGRFDFTLKWAPDPSLAPIPMPPGGGGPTAEGPPPSDVTGPSIFTAIQEQLGLKLESTKGPVDIIVIDRIEKPSED